MRVGLLISLPVYTTGLVAIMIDVGRPWNFWNIMLPWRWNTHSPLWEVALCMPLYAFFPLLLENTPPLLERIYYLYPNFRAAIRQLVPVIRTTYPWVVALAYVLPILHQSSLGALMLLAGDRVHPLWQTPMLPLLYVWAAAYIGTATVIVTLLVCFLAWKRPLDVAVLRALSSLASKLLRRGEAVAYCRAPYCVYADDAVRILRANGLTARRLDVGFPEWRRAGLPIETTV